MICMIIALLIPVSPTPMAARAPFSPAYHDESQQLGMGERYIPQCAHLAPDPLSGPLSGTERRQKVVGARLIEVLHNL